MSDKIVEFPGITRLDLPVDRVLEGGKDQLESVVIIGYDNNGEEYFASTIASGPEVLWLLERCKQRLLTVELDDE